MVGRELAASRAGRARRASRARRCSSSTTLWVAGDRGDDAVRGVTLDVRAGEIVAVAGVAGNGQRELAETVAGMRPADARARSSSTGEPLRGGDPREAIRAGVAHVPEDRLHTGVAPRLSIASNVVLKSYRGRRALARAAAPARRDPRPRRRS